jgi:hypothetical protein
MLRMTRTTTTAAAAVVTQMATDMMRSPSRIRSLDRARQVKTAEYREGRKRIIMFIFVNTVSIDFSSKWFL